MNDLIASNKRRTVFLIFSFVLILVAVGSAAGLVLGNPVFGTVIALIISSVMSVTSYCKSDVIALAVSRAKPADEIEYKRLHNLVEGLCIAGGLPKPRIYVIDDPAPNAFATGRDKNHAAVAVTSGLLQMMNRTELEGVIAHELSHVGNRDILISTIVVVLAGFVSILSHMFLRFFNVL